MIHRRTFLKTLAVSAGAAALAACSGQRRVRYVTFTPGPAQPASLDPTATLTPTATATPDLSSILGEAQKWFQIDEVLRIVALSGPVGGETFSDGLLARVAGRERIVALRRGEEWVVNIPRLGDTSQGKHTSADFDTARRELIERGYGYDLILNTEGFYGRTGIVGAAASGGPLRSNCYGDLFELPRPAGASVEVRWRGENWVGGPTNSKQWQDPLPLKFDGTEPFFSGNFLLTCDDAVNEEDTRSILDFAEKNKVKMTFFPNTPYVKQFPDMWKDIVRQRHEIGFHTTRHSHGDWTPSYLETDCNYFQDTLRQVTGYADYRVVTARPPFGLWYQGGWQDWVESRGLVTAMWSRTIGWDSTPKVIRRTIKENGGLILLAHANPLNVKWFKDNADLLQEMLANYHWTTITDALYKNAQPVTHPGVPLAAAE